jgi:hypothetical protein
MDYLKYGSYFVFGAIGLYLVMEIISSMKKDKSKKTYIPIEEARDSLLKEVKDLPFFVDIVVKKNLLSLSLVIRFRDEPSFKVLMDLPLSHKGYYVETKIIKSNKNGVNSN